MTAYSALLPPSALGLVPVRRDAGLPLGKIHAAMLMHLRQFRSDLAGSPEMAEHIHRIISSTIST